MSWFRDLICWRNTTIENISITLILPSFIYESINQSIKLDRVHLGVPRKNKTMRKEGGTTKYGHTGENVRMNPRPLLTSCVCRHRWYKVTSPSRCASVLSEQPELDGAAHQPNVPLQLSPSPVCVRALARVSLQTGWTGTHLRLRHRKLRASERFYTRWTADRRGRGHRDTCSTLGWEVCVALERVHHDDVDRAGAGGHGGGRLCSELWVVWSITLWTKPV